MDDLFSLIKEHVTIFELMEEYAPESFRAIRSRQVGHKIPCPFAASRHNRGRDLNPSCKFFPENQSIYCWTCHGSWDVISFYAEANGMFKLDEQGRPITAPGRGEVLDYGAAAAALARAKGIEFKSPDWYQRLRRTLKVLETRQASVIPPAQWAKLEASHIDRLLAWAYNERKLSRPATGAALDYVLSKIPEGGQPGVERELPKWFIWAQQFLERAEALGRIPA